MYIYSNDNVIKIRIGLYTENNKKVEDKSDGINLVKVEYKAYMWLVYVYCYTVYLFLDTCVKVYMICVYCMRMVVYKVCMMCVYCIHMVAYKVCMMCVYCMYMVAYKVYVMSWGGKMKGS